MMDRYLNIPFELRGYSGFKNGYPLFTLIKNGKVIVDLVMRETYYKRHKREFWTNDYSEEKSLIVGNIFAAIEEGWYYEDEEEES